MTQTKAEQLATTFREINFANYRHDDVVLLNHWSEEAFDELRRLSQIEAELVKSNSALLNCHYRYEDAVAVNKVLIDAVQVACKHMVSRGQYPHVDKDWDVVDSALKLAGEIK